MPSSSLLPACEATSAPALTVCAALAGLIAPFQEAPGPAPAPLEDSAAALVAGELPAGTTGAARRAWEALLAAAFPAGDPAPIAAFDLEFDARIYSGERATNDVDGRYRYLAPGLVRIQLEASGRETLRGPAGDWLVFEDGRKVKLEGREYELDVAELDRAVSVAQSFVALADPRTLRIARLELLAAPPSSIPDGLTARAAELEWLLLETPDLAPAPAPAAGAAPALQRLELGLERESHLPSLAIVRSSELGPEGLETAQLLDLGNFRAIDRGGGDERRVPHKVVAYGPDPTTSPWTFDLRRATFELYVVRGTLRPALALADFQP